MEPTAVRLLKYYATNGKLKARCWYSPGVINGLNCVTVYAKDYGYDLGKVFEGTPQAATYKNDTDITTDYFDKDSIRIFESSPLYPQALALAGRA